MPILPARATTRAPSAASDPGVDTAAPPLPGWFRGANERMRGVAASSASSAPRDPPPAVIVWTPPRAAPGPAVPTGDGLPPDYRIVRLPPPPPFTDYAPVDPFFGVGSIFPRVSSGVTHGDL